MTKERCEIRASFCTGVAVQRRQLTRSTSTPFNVCLGCQTWMDRQGIATIAAPAEPPGSNRSPKVRR